MTVPVGADFDHGAKLSTSDEHPPVKLSEALLNQILPNLGLARISFLFTTLIADSFDVSERGRVDYMACYLCPCSG